MNIVFKAFIEGDGYFIYDRNTNKILSVPESDYKVLTTSVDLENKSVVLQKYQSRGFLLESRLEKIKHPINDFLQTFEDEKVTQLILQVTQDCNLRCSYCYYVNEDYRNRHHSKLHMDTALAYKAMDYLLLHSAGKNEITLGFYGGEPLIKFDLIKECVHYMEANVQDRKVLFTLTTNGTLLTDEIVEFFIEHNVALLISLDGTKDTHDKNRVFANGKGSFDVVMQKVAHIKNKYPDFFKKLYFNTVISPEMDMACVREYYSANDVLEDAHFTSSTIQEFYTDNPVEYDDRLFIDSQFGEFQALLACAGRLKNTDVPLVYTGEISDITKMMQNLHTDFLLPSEYHHGGPCIAGSRRLFVDVTGNFYPCERVSESSETMHLGSLETGFQIEKAKAIMNVGSVTEKQCKSCWSLVHCRMCAAWADNLNGFDKDKKLAACPIYQRSVIHRFKNICALKHFANSSIVRKVGK
ncbi:MAG: Cys-rich peptide radical SAM maturase CcpM [Christensenellaceae bacterium]